MAIDTAFVKQFGTNVDLLAQQKGSRLRGAVRVETGIVGEEAYFDQLQATAAVKRTTRHADTPIIDTGYSRRKVTLYDYEWADLIDKQDKLKMLIDPQSAYVVNAANALGRSMDDEIIAAALGTAYTGKDGSSSVPFPIGNIVPSGASGLTVAKLLSAKEILDGNDVDESLPRYIVCSAKQITDLLNTTEVKSSDYNTVKALAMGQIDSFLGFKFIRSERLSTNSSDERQVIAFAQPGILLGISSDFKARIDERADKSYAVQVYCSLGIGATRMQEEMVVEIDCAE